MSTVLFVGGGTLGSINPLLATAKALGLQHPDVQCAFWVSRIPRDSQVVREAGFTATALPSGKFRRYFSLWNIIDVPVVCWATITAWVKLRKLKPKVVVTAGSYVAVPVAWAARRLHVPVILYQQDTTLGLANRLVARSGALRTAASESLVPLLPPPVDVVGYALRPDLRAGKAERVWAKYHLQPDQPTLLVVGGSSGALGLNERFAACLAYLDPHVQVLHVTGDGKAPALQRPGYVQIPFTYVELADLYAAATFVVTRAGSNILAELMALGKPMLIVPLPGTHQVQNAVNLEERGALVRDEVALEPKAFAELLNGYLLSSDKLRALAAATASAWDTDGASHLAKLIIRYL